MKIKTLIIGLVLSLSVWAQGTVTKATKKSTAPASHATLTSRKAGGANGAVANTPAPFHKSDAVANRSNIKNNVAATTVKKSTVKTKKSTVATPKK